MSDEGKLVNGLEVVRIDNGEVVRTVEINPPVGDLSRRLERIMGGMLTNMHEDFFLRERYV